MFSDCLVCRQTQNLFNVEFIIRTDHNALQWSIKKEHSESLARLIMKPQDFNFSVKHIRGKDNVIADALSRGVLKFRTDEADEKWVNHENCK